jgi:hypothetical protein
MTCTVETCISIYTSRRSDAANVLNIISRAAYEGGSSVNMAKSKAIPIKSRLEYLLPFTSAMTQVASSKVGGLQKAASSDLLYPCVHCRFDLFEL